MTRRLPSSLTLSQCTLLGEGGGIRHWYARWEGTPYKDFRATAAPLAVQASCEVASYEVFVKELVSSDEEVQRRFQQEGQVAARLLHSGVTYLVARSAEQLCFDWIPGQSLRALLNTQRTLPTSEGLLLLRELLSALAYLHAQGVVHHDLKPENIMLPVGWPQVSQPVILVDLGMAYDPQQPHDLHAGTRMGTPQFMSPEQFRGVRGDPRSDLYAAGAVLFDALVGQPPFPNALGWLAGFDISRLPLPGPPALSTLLEAALQRDPNQRVQSAEQMLRMLEDIAL